MKHDFDVLVIGGGHAGAEAAQAAYRLGVRVCLVTHSFSKIGEMSCNPAIGGLGKGHLVREIDALDGVMGRVADRSGIQFRLLNRSKGPAVQGPRTQTDRKLYREAMQGEFSNRPDLEIIEGEVSEFIFSKGVVSGAVLLDGSRIVSKSVVLTAGTFLRGVVHIGDRAIPAGRMGDKPAAKLGEFIDSLGLPLGRLKTGTPPRLNGKTIDWSVLELQEADPDPTFFSFLTSELAAKQVSCGITYTNEITHKIIRENIGRSAMYGGNISGVGPRYCPSIEDKVVRFEEKPRHQVFLEPESLSDYVIYPNGISTSLPEDVQHSYVRSIAGLEKVEILQPGYAIEYDYVDPRALGEALNVRDIPGLYFAGQINGTTGYEEAAAQGLIAGLNAALAASGRGPFILDRADGYIGVMIDDLTTNGVIEPYRMFTSRAEYRLSARADNADQRLTPMGIELGCVGSERQDVFAKKSEALSKWLGELKSRHISPNDASKSGIDLSQDGVKRSAYDLLSYPNVSMEQICDLWPDLGMPTEIEFDVVCDARYSRYVERQAADIEALRKDRARRIPEGLDYASIDGLSNELKKKLTSIRPEDLGRASRIDGMTPSALTLILAQIRKSEYRKAL